MNILAALCFLFSVLAAGMFVLAAQNPPPAHTSQPLSEFIIGRWAGRFVEDENGQPREYFYQLEFSRPDEVLYSRRTPNHLNFNVALAYELAEPNRLIVQARELDEWTVSRNGAFLNIVSSNGLLRDGQYAPMPVLPWPLLAFAIGGLILALVCLQFNVPKVEARGAPSQPSAEYKLTKNSALLALLLLLLFCASVASTILIWQSPALRLIRLPWDISLMLEAGLVLCLMAVKSRVFGRWSHSGAGRLRLGQLSVVRILALGAACGSLGLGLSKLAVFAVFRSYPFG